MKPLRTVSSLDTFAALQLMTQVVDNEVAGFIAEGEIPQDLPTEVSDAIGLIVQSSGSTGTPKRIEIPLSALKHSAISSATRLGGEGQWLLALPTNFIAGANVLFRSVIADTQPVLINTRVPFTTDAFIRGASLMEGARRYTSLVPAQLSSWPQPQSRMLLSSRCFANLMPSWSAASNPIGQMSRALEVRV